MPEDTDPVAVAVRLIDKFSEDLAKLDAHIEKIDANDINVDFDIESDEEVASVKAQLDALERRMEAVLAISLRGVERALAAKAALEEDGTIDLDVDRGTIASLLSARAATPATGGDGTDPPSVQRPQLPDDFSAFVEGDVFGGVERARNRPAPDAPDRPFNEARGLWRDTKRNIGSAVEVPRPSVNTDVDVPRPSVSTSLRPDISVRNQLDQVRGRTVDVLRDIHDSAGETNARIRDVGSAIRDQNNDLGENTRRRLSDALRGVRAGLDDLTVSREEDMDVRPVTPTLRAPQTGLREVEAPEIPETTVRLSESDVVRDEDWGRILDRGVDDDTRFTDTLRQAPSFGLDDVEITGGADTDTQAFTDAGNAITAERRYLDQNEEVNSELTRENRIDRSREVLDHIEREEYTQAENVTEKIRRQEDLLPDDVPRMADRLETAINEGREGGTQRGADFDADALLEGINRNIGSLEEFENEVESPREQELAGEARQYLTSARDRVESGVTTDDDLGALRSDVSSFQSRHREIQEHNISRLGIPGWEDKLESVKEAQDWKMDGRWSEDRSRDAIQYRAWLDNIQSTLETPLEDLHAVDLYDTAEMVDEGPPADPFEGLSERPAPRPGVDGDTFRSRGEFVRDTLGPMARRQREESRQRIMSDYEVDVDVPDIDDPRQGHMLTEGMEGSVNIPEFDTRDTEVDGPVEQLRTEVPEVDLRTVLGRDDDSRDSAPRHILDRQSESYENIRRSVGDVIDRSRTTINNVTNNDVENRNIIERENRAVSRVRETLGDIDFPDFRDEGGGFTIPTVMGGDGGDGADGGGGADGGDGGRGGRGSALRRGLRSAKRIPGAIARGTPGAVEGMLPNHPDPTRGGEGNVEVFEQLEAVVRKLIPSYRTWLTVISVLVPMMIAVSGAALGLAAAFGTLAIAGASVLALGFGGFGSNLEESLQEAQKRTQRLKEEMYGVMRPVMQDFAPWTARFMDIAPSQAQKLVEPLRGLETFMPMIEGIFRGGATYIARVIELLTGLDDEITQITDRALTGLAGAFKAVLTGSIEEVYQNQEMYAKLLDTFLRVAGAVYVLFQRVAQMVAVFSPLINVVTFLVSLLNNRYVSALLTAMVAMAGVLYLINALAGAFITFGSLGIATMIYEAAAAFTAYISQALIALGVTQGLATSVAMLTAGLSVLGAVAAGAWAGMSALEMSGMDGPAAGASDFGDYGPGPGMGGGGGGSMGGDTYINVEGNVGKSEYNKMRDNFSELSGQQAGIRDSKQR